MTGPVGTTGFPQASVMAGGVGRLVHLQYSSLLIHYPAEA